VRVEFATVTVELDAPPASTPDAYLRLHLLSHLLVKPNTVNLDGIFGTLPIVVWTTAGPMHPDAYARLRPALQRAGISAHGIDRFPRLLDYVAPARVRIADASRVRLGAHLAPGTTVMQEGFVNYNAGTLGTSMGDDSVVEAGLYVTAGTKVSLVVPGEEPRTVKALELSGIAGLLFRRNSQTGAVEVLPRSGDGVELNAALHH
jgi:2,3,4,5-tetrahydropyridine-2-carboxylate N-succinyltransferase